MMALRREDPTLYRLPCPNTTTSSASTRSSAIISDDSSWRHSSGSSATEFEDIGSPPGECSEIVPLTLSDSVKRLLKRSNAKCVRLSTDALSSPATSSMIQIPTFISSVSDLKGQMTLSPTTLAMVGDSNTRWLPRSATPSLTFSNTTEDVSSVVTMDVPPVAEADPVQRKDPGWDVVATQLQAKAMDVLLQLSPEFQQLRIDSASSVLAPTPVSTEELMLSVPRAAPMHYTIEHEPLSAISVPSPGAFFASLGDVSRKVWRHQHTDNEALESPTPSASDVLIAEPSLRSTSSDVCELSTAERLQNVHVQVTTLDTHTRGKSYEQSLQSAASTNLDRTRVWLQAQETYLSALLQPYELPTPKAALDPLQNRIAQGTRLPRVLSPKKSVRFANTSLEIPPPAPATCSALVYHAFQHLLSRAHPSDAFIHRAVRAEALQTQRCHLPEAHRSALKGDYSTKERPARTETTILSLPSAPDDSVAAMRGKTIARVHKEQTTLQQLSVQVWNLEAMRFLNGGSLLYKTALAVVNRLEKRDMQPFILDINSSPAASWGWAVALAHLQANVYTAVPEACDSTSLDWTVHREPSNHRTTKVVNTWSLPFPDDTFDIISARTLHELLRTASRHEDGANEFDATLHELHRVLAPGGVLQFALLDAEVVAPTGSKLASISAEFVGHLEAHGYDPRASRTFLSRVADAGFECIERAWITLPLGNHEQRGVELVTELVGTVAWEQWMAQVQAETSRVDEGMLKDFGDSLLEAQVRSGGVQGVGWKMLIGCARKPF